MLRSFILFAGLVLALGLAACPQQQADDPDTAVEVTEEEVVVDTDPVEDAASDAADSASDTASDAMDSASDAANDAADSASDAANDAMDKADGMMDDAKDAGN